MLPSTWSQPNLLHITMERVETKLKHTNMSDACRGRLEHPQNSQITCNFDTKPADEHTWKLEVHGIADMRWATCATQAHTHEYDL